MTRICADDPGADTIVAVRLDGALIPPETVCMLDTVEGFVDVIVSDNDGQILTDPRDPEKIWIVRKFGKVEFERRIQRSRVE